MATEIEYGVNDDAGNNPFEKNFDSEDQAIEAGNQFLRTNPLAEEVIIFRLEIVNGVIQTDETMRSISRAEIGRSTGDRLGRAELFMSELLDSVETLTGIAEQHGSKTLANLMYLQAAIVSDEFIEIIEPDESSVMEIVETLPSANVWKEYIDSHPDS